MDLRLIVAHAEMPADDLFVLKKIFSLDEIIEMHMAVFVDDILAVIWCQKGHFGDENLGSKHIGVAIKTGRSRVAGVGNQWNSRLRCDFDTRDPCVADLVTGPIGELRF